MSTPQKANFGELLSKIILPKVHIIALLVSAIGLIFKYLNLSGSADMLMVGFSSLAAVYFLSAFTVVNTLPNSKHSPYALILFKLLYMAAAVTVIGLLFFVLKLDSYKEMLLAGGGTLGLAVLISAALIGTNRDNMPILRGPFLMSIPLFLITAYFLYQLNA